MQPVVSEAKTPGEINFNLHTLGWRNFQDLCSIVLREVFAQTFRTFADSNDGGRDGAFSGIWGKPLGSLTEAWREIPRGETVVQCKFTTKSSATLSLSMLEDEFSKISKLVEKGLCKNYILMTNATVSGTSEAKIVAKIKALGVHYVLILDGRWINQTISLNHSLRMYIPRVYGLGDLSLILDERAEKQARVILNQVGDLNTFVITDAYKRAADGLKTKSFVLLLGEPASGKSVIAAALSISAIDQWNSQVIKITSAEEFLQHWNTDHKNQLFWIDDAFGSIKLDQSITDMWARNMPAIMAAAKEGAKIVMTSRDYIYKEARLSLKEYYYPLLEEGRVVIRVERLTDDEKGKILYNHIRLGDQPKIFKTQIKSHLLAATHAQRFLPEMARRLSLQAFTKQLDHSIEKEVVKFVEKQNAYVNGIFEELNENHIAALALIYLNGVLMSPIELNRRQKNVIQRLGGIPHKIALSLESLSGNIVKYIPQAHPTDKAPHWTFHHPTLREAFARFVMRKDSLIDIFIDGLTVEEALSQLDCGETQKEGQLLHVPRVYYRAVINKLSPIDEMLANAPTSQAKFALEVDYHSFLANASKEFLKDYIATAPTLIEDCVKGIGPYLYASSENRLIVALHSKGLLPENQRQKVVDKYKELAVGVPDSGWIDSFARKLLNEHEENEIRAIVSAKLIPRLGEVIEEWQEYEDSDTEYYSRLVETLESYRDKLFIYADYDKEYSLLDSAIDELSDLIDEHQSRLSEPPENYDPLYANSSTDSTASQRSIFEDVDE